MCSGTADFGLACAAEHRGYATSLELIFGILTVLGEGHDVGVLEENVQQGGAPPESPLGTVFRMGTDTPPAKAGRFSVALATCGPCPERSSDRAEIRDGVRLHLAVDAMRCFRADGGAAVHVSVHPRATAQTPQAAPARRGGLDMSTVAAGLRRIRLVDPLHAGPQPRRVSARERVNCPWGHWLLVWSVTCPRLTPVWRSRTSPTTIWVTPSRTRRLAG